MTDAKKKAATGNTTRCSKCKKDKFVNPVALAARIKKFGSLEKIAELWVCRECTPKKEKKAKAEKAETAVTPTLRKRTPAVKRVIDDLKADIPYEEPSIEQED